MAIPPEKSVPLPTPKGLSEQGGPELEKNLSRRGSVRLPDGDSPPDEEKARMEDGGWSRHSERHPPSSILYPGFLPCLRGENGSYTRPMDLLDTQVFGLIGEDGFRRLVGAFTRAFARTTCWRRCTPRRISRGRRSGCATSSSAVSGGRSGTSSGEGTRGCGCVDGPRSRCQGGDSARDPAHVR